MNSTSSSTQDTATLTSSQAIEPTSSIRRYDVDWLRVVLFGLLIPFHVAVGLVWGAYGGAFDGQSAQNTYNNNVIVESFVLQWMHTWRLPALFLISGMGTAFATRKRTPGGFRKERFSRIAIPFLFGITVVNMPFWWIQAWVEDPSLNGDPIGLVLTALFWTVIIALQNLGTAFELSLHLWFLKNLFIYSLVLSAFMSSWKNPESRINRRFRKWLSSWWGIMFIVPLPLFLVELFIKPGTYGYTGHGYEFFWYFVFFLLGFLLIISKDKYFESLEKYRIGLTGGAIVFSVLLFVVIGLTGRASELALNGGWIWEGIGYFDPVFIFTSFVHTYHAWFWSLVLFSWFAKFLNKPSKQLTYLNQAVYPLYIWHMTFVFIALFLLQSTDLPLYTEFILGTLFTFMFSFMGVELVKRNKNTRRLFGIKETGKPSELVAVTQGQPVGPSPPVYAEPINYTEAVYPTLLSCPNCKSPVGGKFLFCRECGHPLKKS